MTMDILSALGHFLLRYRLWVILALTLALGIALVPGFFSLRTLAFNLDTASTVGIVAVGMTVVLIAGRIDLSVGSILAFCGIVVIDLEPVLGPWLATLIGIATGGAIGLVNAGLVIALGIDSMIATLATMLGVRSLAHLVTNSLPVTGVDQAFGAALTGDLIGAVTSRVVIFLVLIALLQLWLSRTPAGRNLYAVGSNTVAARDSGINATRYIVGAFVFAGLCAGLAGVLLSLNVNTGSPVFGATVLISAVVAVVMGGTPLEGGRGSAFGTLGGVVTVGAMTTAFEYASVPAYTQQIAIGTILVFLIIMDRLALAARTRRSAESGTSGPMPGGRAGPGAGSRSSLLKLTHLAKG
jgi:ribose/xylose/arabinose/galactoside ABC-type transport system permease subunit